MRSLEKDGRGWRERGEEVAEESVLVRTRERGSEQRGAELGRRERTGSRSFPQKGRKTRRGKERERNKKSVERKKRRAEKECSVNDRKRARARDRKRPFFLRVRFRNGSMRESGQLRSAPLRRPCCAGGGRFLAMQPGGRRSSTARCQRLQRRAAAVTHGAPHFPNSRCYGKKLSSRLTRRGR